MTRGIPGPGTYRLKDLVGSDSKATTLKQRLAETKTSNFYAPGPGTYNARYEIASVASPKWNLGSSAGRNDESKRRLKTSYGPRPDSYNPLFALVRERLPSWSFGSGGRSNLASVGLSSPAPGTYSIPNRGVEGVRRSFGQKLDFQSAIG